MKMKLVEDCFHTQGYVTCVHEQTLLNWDTTFPQNVSATANIEKYQRLLKIIHYSFTDGSCKESKVRES